LKGKFKGNLAGGTEAIFEVIRKGSFERQVQKQILKVFWLGEPKVI
jgi:hypothetical protein